MTYPCPSADPGWSGCQTVVTTATTSLAATTTTGASAGGTCAFSDDVACNGNQCCPGVAASSFQTYPCGSADPGWNGCSTSLKQSGEECGWSYPNLFHGVCAEGLECSVQTPNCPDCPLKCG